ncbi:hypothetical protein INS49_014946 [Diaporthe citri]|uniref:uncharacterized protein n=1 Tax=Diaporthe citri TaxID=83186 RepID=UPI001C81193E|nr:uncharacterized protein INS49_014946 [Diaporthe citri]KAG6357069.1 hypothetical protein INS49_014946 [Diaporthe citri]
MAEKKGELYAEPGAHELERGASAGAVDINRNIEAKISNPLAGIPKSQLMRQVDAFAHEKGLADHIPILRKGALVAQLGVATSLTREDYDSIGGEETLTEEEKTVLENEVKHKWRLPWRLWLTVITCSIGAAVQGWDQTGSNGANLFFPKVYGIGSKSVHDTLIVGLVNAGPYIGSAVLGCWLTDPVNNWLGRRGVIFVSANFCLWPVIGSAFCHAWPEQLACRLLMGIGMGIKASTVPVYAAENSPAPVRGALVMTWQLWTAFGIFFGTVINLAVYHMRDQWRYMLGAPFIPAVPLLCLIYLCPESPRWLIKKNRYVKAWESLVRLRNHEIQIARDLYNIHAALDLESHVIAKSTYVVRFFELFTIPRVRRATLAAFTVMIAQQMCGINIIAFYSSTVFEDAGATQYEALTFSLIFGAVNFLFAFPALKTIDTFGRRSLLLFTFPQMTWTLLAAGLCTLIDKNNSARTGLVALFVYLFAAFYSPGEGPVPFTYSAEVFPLSHREVGMSFAVATCLFWAAILSISFPFLLAKTGTVGAFGFYAGLNAVAFVMIFFWVPETKQKTLEELDYVFAVPTSKFAQYQLTQAAPWWVKRYVLFQKSATLKPLYHEEHRHQAAESEQFQEKSAEASDPPSPRHLE